MANFAVDPRPHIPAGFSWRRRAAPREPHRMRVFLGPSGVKANEDLAIALTTPPVDKEDFHQMAYALHLFLRDEHHVRNPEVQQCPMGEAFVQFGCPLERLKFLKSSPLQFGQYLVRFIKHDEGDNARAIDMDREVWLMLLCYPNDFRDDSEIDKAIAGFAILKHIHRSSNASRVVIKALVNKEDDIPDDIVVSPGDSPRAPSWTVPIFLLHAEDLAVVGDEDALPPEGPLHPKPAPAPRWMGVNGEFSHVNTHEDATVENVRHLGVDPVLQQVEPAAVEMNAGITEGADGTAAMVDEQLTDQEIEEEIVVQEEERITVAVDKPVAFGPPKPPQSASIPLKVVFNRIFQSLSPGLHTFPFHNISSISINLDTLIPGYFADSDLLWHMAKVLVEDSPVGAVPETGVIDQDSDVEILDSMPASVKPKKRWARKMRGPLDIKHVRRSTRLKKTHGFRDDASAAAAGAEAEPVEEPAPVVEPEAAVDAVMEPAPLKVLPAQELITYKPIPVDPPAPIAPHLSVSMMQAIGSGYLKMPPGALSDEMLGESSANE
ncbi:unnamed protein product [Urochloa humidicola]